jgi:hypothetical protein
MSIDIVVRDKLQNLINQALLIPDNCEDVDAHLEGQEEMESFFQSNYPLILEYLSTMQDQRVQDNQHLDTIAKLKGEAPLFRENVKKMLELCMIISQKGNSQAEYNEQKAWFDELCKIA